MLQRVTALAVAFAVALSALPARAAEVVDLALILAVDVSRSIDSDEYRLQREGYARAFSDPRVINAIRSGSHRRIAVQFIEWSTSDMQQVVVDWTVIGDEESAALFSAAIMNISRTFADRTSISGGIDFAVRQFARAAPEAPVVALLLLGQGHAHLVVEVVHPDAVQAGLGDQFRQVAVILGQQDVPAAQRVRLARQFVQDVLLAVVLHAGGRVQPQAVEAVVLQPHARVPGDVAAHVRLGVV